MEKKKQIKWGKELIEKLRCVWTSGTTEEIKLVFGDVSNRTLGDAARRFGIKRDYEFKCKRKLVKLLDETTYNYYWLGFIMADGHFSKKGELKITLGIKDIEHLKKFANYIDANVHICDGQTYGKYTSNDSCRLSMMDVNSVKVLNNRFGINHRKTYTACSIDCLDTDEKFLAFFCGLVDGDGCITQGNLGRANMLRIQCDASWFQVYEIIGIRLKELFDINYKCYIDKKGFCKFSIHHYNDLVKLKKEISKLEIPYLERKWSKIDETNPINTINLKSRDAKRKKLKTINVYSLDKKLLGNWGCASDLSEFSLSANTCLTNKLYPLGINRSCKTNKPYKGYFFEYVN